ncbi:hypothetical protein SAMN02910358_02472 [Lachnospiraceae bacterium XBB1006]|nr:hypothetical protein SAMN02910358_02472 [Lachnospiraceae bacterium XBB1006]
MDMKVKTGIISGLVVLIVVISGWVGTIGDDYANDYNNEGKLKSEASSYSYVKRFGTVEKREADLQFDFSGNDVLWEIEADKDCTLSGNYDIVISRGDFKIILVSPLAEITSVWEMGNGDNYGNLNIPLAKGMNRIKIVGKRAKGAMKLRLNPSWEGVKITPREHS